MNQNVFVMKNLIGIILLGLIVSSCSLFQKSSMTQDQIDEMVAENEALKTKVNASKDLEDQLALARMQADEAMLKLAVCEDASTSKVHIIVGAFKNSSYADEYSAEMKKQGYDGRIIAGPYNFNLVTSSSHESVKSALNALGNIRETIIETAWLYIE
jgi:hypothetical protein